MIPDAPAPAILRILDANANRAREALRVLEDHARFGLNHAGLTETLKHIRHDLAAALALLPMDAALLARDTPGDVGTTIKTAAEFQRVGLRDVATANAKRLSEALRSLEESAKTINPAAAAAMEKLRYRGYAAERTMAQAEVRTAAATALPRSESRVDSGAARFGAVRLYLLMTASLCGPPADPLPWDSLLELILESVATTVGEAFPVCVQLREKNLEDADLLARAQLLVHKCRQFGALAIINDRPDIAQLAGADGVHLGQTDLPCAQVRKLLGPAAIIGVSTESLEQARAAVSAGATYVAAGPMFLTTTKEKPRIVGPQYAAEAVASIPLPLVAIGGITPENVGQVTAAGIRCVAVSSAILRAADPRAVVQALLGAIQ